MMRKEITIDVRLLIQAEDEASHDFAAASIKAVREIIRAGSATRPDLKVRIKRAAELSE